MSRNRFIHVVENKHLGNIYRDVPLTTGDTSLLRGLSGSGDSLFGLSEQLYDIIGRSTAVSGQINLIVTLIRIVLIFREPGKPGVQLLRVFHLRDNQQDRIG